MSLKRICICLCEAHKVPKVVYIRTPKPCKGRPEVINSQETLFTHCVRRPSQRFCFVISFCWLFFFTSIFSWQYLKTPASCESWFPLGSPLGWAQGPVFMWLLDTEHPDYLEQKMPLDIGGFNVSFLPWFSVSCFWFLGFSCFFASLAHCYILFSILGVLCF